jgi:shikimate kinase
MQPPQLPAERRHFILIGMMGAGKSTVGRVLSRRMGLPFVDTDKLIVERTGVPIATIFEVEGEAGFRDRESALIAGIADLPASVIATGGGAVLRAENREAMRTHGTVIFLSAEPPELIRRLRNDRARPLLATGAPEERIRQLVAERDALYRAAAHLVIETRSQGVGRLVGDLVQKLLRHDPPLLK